MVYNNKKALEGRSCAMKTFEIPEIEITKFEAEDVITTSIENPGIDNMGDLVG